VNREVFSLMEIPHFWDVYDALHERDVSTFVNRNVG
jgi:hypothetical protein